MSFRFRLDPILRWRELQLRQALGLLASALSDEAQVRAHLRERESAQDAASQELRISPGDTAHAATLQDQARRNQAMGTAVASARLAIAACETKRTKAQHAVANRRADLKALERLRAQAQDEYWTAQRKLEQKHIDELASTAHGNAQR